MLQLVVGTVTKFSTRSNAGKRFVHPWPILPLKIACDKLQIFIA